MADSSIGTAAQLRDPNYTPPLTKAIPLGIQHVLAMFISNITPAIIIAGAAGFGFGSDAGAQGFPDMTYLIQMSMLFAGIATLFQTIGMGPGRWAATYCSRNKLCFHSDNDSSCRR